MKENTVFIGDCLTILDHIPDQSIDLIYLDPPFFSGKEYKNRTKTYSFNDIWHDHNDYGDFLLPRLAKCKEKLKKTGSIFVHCDRNGNHIIRTLLEHLFGSAHFQSEIIWTYHRWSNAKKGLLNQHQNILFFSNSSAFKWHTEYQDYSPMTNLDQILQKRKKHQGKSIYATDEKGDIIYTSEKKGVPLGDIWEIPFLNPRAKERVDYPTQKPIALLERIIRLTTDEGDTVLDPFCGSGSTLVAAHLLKRHYIGIDISQEAIALSQQRLNSPYKTLSEIEEKGKESIRQHPKEVSDILSTLPCSPVYRNRGIDAFLKTDIKGKMVAIKVQKLQENLNDAYQRLYHALNKRPNTLGYLIQTQPDHREAPFDDRIQIIQSLPLQMQLSQK